MGACVCGVERWWGWAVGQERKREAKFNKREADEKNQKSRTSHKKQQKRSTETISMKIKETLCFALLALLLLLGWGEEKKE